jgi:peptide/nickel transport system substrate-binding protein
LPKHIFGSATPADLPTTPEGRLPIVTSGPFSVSARVAGVAGVAGEIDLVKNPHYFEAPRPSLDRVTFKTYADASAVLSAVQDGLVDTASNLPGVASGELTSVPGYNTAISPNPAVFYGIAFNFLSPIATEAPVREALAIGLDVPALRTSIWQTSAQATCDDASNTFAHQPSLIGGEGTCAYGPDGATFDSLDTRAKQLLEDDRWEAPASGAGVRSKDGRALTVRILVAVGDAEENAIAQSVVAQWKSLGVDGQVAAVSVTALQAAVLHPTAATYDAVVLRRPLSADPDDSALFLSDETPAQGGANVMSYSNAQVDAWELQQLTTIDQAVRLKVLQSIHAQVLQDVPLIFLYAAPALSVARSSVHNYAPSGVGPSETWNIADWWIDGAAETPTALPS